MIPANLFMASFLASQSLSRTGFGTLYLSVINFTSASTSKKFICF